ncbi:MAG: hypothetical protein FJZ01_03375 [Candidatus Sericytochromatia bacterium]|nr:hypothetical protein [Candidatus Tanganyikabacteria bacterium]
MQCKVCATKLQVVGRFAVCPEHGVSEATPAPSAGVDLDTLPSVIAIPLSEMDTETHPIVRLWRICDTAELLLRLVVAIAASELDTAGGISESLAELVASRIERPTLHQWLEMASTLAQGVESTVGSGAVVPELRATVDEVLFGLVAGRRKGEEESVLDLRNRLAHGAGFGREAGESLLPGYRERLLGAVRELRWLTEVKLVASGAGGEPVILAGPRFPAVVGTADLSAAAREALAARGGEVALVRGERVVALWPLQAYLRPELLRTRRGDTVAGEDPVPLVYAKRQGSRLEMTGLGSSMPVSELRGSAVDRLEQLFRIAEIAGLRRDAPDDFREEFRREAEALVGRADVCSRIDAAVRAARSGVLWLHGRPGTGKSAVMARMAIDLEGAEGRGQRLVAYRFRAGDRRSTRAKFLRYAVGRLESWRRLGVPRTDLPDDPRRLERRLGDLLRVVAPPLRVVFLLDGLDEIARIDPEFPELPLQHAGDGVVWVCAGRPEPALDRLYETAGCTRIFPGDGLPGLSDREVDEWLKRDAPAPQRDMIVRQEAREGGVAPWIVAVRRQSGGLPAYITLLLDDLCTFEVAVGQITPSGLPAYFDSLLARSGVDDPAATLPLLMAVVALAVEAPAAETIAEVLARAGHLKAATASQHQAIVQEALARARAMIRTIATAPEAYLPYHDELTAHLLETPSLRNARAAVAEGWKSLAADPGGAGATARKQAYAAGIRQLVRLEDDESALRLFSDFAYHERRAADLGPGAALAVLDDLAIVHAQIAYRRDAAFDAYMSFLSRASRPAAWKRCWPAVATRRLIAAAFLGRHAGILRRQGDLGAAQAQLEAGLPALFPGPKAPAALFQEYGRLEYELGYVRFLLGDLAGARRWLDLSSDRAALAGDEVGAWIGRCVKAHFETQYEEIGADRFDAILQAAHAVFATERWNPVAERWVMNCLAHRFDAAFWRGDRDAAEGLGASLLAHSWVAKFGGPRFSGPILARLALLRGDPAAAAGAFREVLEGAPEDGPARARTESLARVYLEFGDALLAAGSPAAARQAWEAGLALPADCGNHPWWARIRARVAQID